MTISLPKVAALGGLCALLLSASGGAIAQDYHHDWHHHGARHARKHLKVLHAVYAHEIKSGHPEAAMKAHMQAKAIRAHIRARHDH